MACGIRPQHGWPTPDAMTITGHKTAAMVGRYTRQADQRRRAESAVAKHARQNGTGPKVYNRSKESL